MKHCAAPRYSEQQFEMAVRVPGEARDAVAKADAERLERVRKSL